MSETANPTPGLPLFFNRIVGVDPEMHSGLRLDRSTGYGYAAVAQSVPVGLGYRKLGVIGTTCLAVGSFLMAQAGMETSRVSLMVFVALMGIGMGLSIPSFLIAVQTSVQRRQLGTATSTLQFSRSMGGTLGVSVSNATPTR